MARQIRNAKLDTPTARSALKVRREPYWTIVSAGCAVGYRRLAVGRGTWIAKFRDPATGQRAYEALGAADDARDADAVSVFSFAQAQVKARAFFVRAARHAAGDELSVGGPFTVAIALEEYFAARLRKGSKSAAGDRKSTDAAVLPVLGNVPVAKLTRRKLEDWLSGVATSPARKHGPGGRTALREMSGSEEEVRRRRSTANRILGTLRAALNHAAIERRDLPVEAWRGVRPFREVATARPRYLTDDEAVRLVNASSPDFRILVSAALLTGARYGELTRLLVRDFHEDSGTLQILKSKSGRPRSIVLSDEGREFFAHQCRGRTSNAVLLARAHGSAWGKSHQDRPMAVACQAAHIPPANFHALRHTYASRLVMRGVTLPVVAAQLGHASIAMVERHYGHLAPSYVADTVRASFGRLGIVEPGEAGKVMSLKLGT